MRWCLGLVVAVLLGAAGCTNTLSGNAVVAGVGDNDLLKLRSGPGLNYSIIMGLPDGTRLRQDRCVTTHGRLWCRVSLMSSPGVTGYVSSSYLIAQ
jgi:uncharacterized protein YraI